jgi:hypothetical protein
MHFWKASTGCSRCMRALLPCCPSTGGYVASAVAHPDALDVCFVAVCLCHGRAPTGWSMMSLKTEHALVRPHLIWECPTSLASRIGTCGASPAMTIGSRRH